MPALILIGVALGAGLRLLEIVIPLVSGVPQILWWALAGNIWLGMVANVQKCVLQDNTRRIAIEAHLALYGTYPHPVAALCECACPQPLKRRLVGAAASGVISRAHLRLAA